MSQPDPLRWWLRPGDVADIIDVDGARVSLIFASDDGILWDLELGSDRIAWDPSAQSLASATDRGLVDDSLRRILRELGWHREGWLLTPVEHAILDEVTRALRVGLNISGRKLRQRLRPSYDVDVDRLRDLVAGLSPRFVTEREGDRGYYYVPTFCGLLASSETAATTKIIEAVLKVIRAKYDEDADFIGYSLDDVVSAGTFADADRSFIHGVITAAHLSRGGSGTEQDGLLRFGYGTPIDVEALADCSSFAAFLSATRKSRTGERPWPTAPLRLERVTRELHRARLVGELKRPPTRGATPGAHVPAPTHETPATRHDLFISHASEDKDALARPLYEALRAAGISVWFDEATLVLGDSLRRKIDEGLAKCRFGVVILSPHFLAKQWPQRELDGLVAREVRSGEPTILPIWHNIDADTLTNYSPTLADKLAANSKQGIPKIVEQIKAALNR